MATFRQREGRWQAIIRRVDLKATKTFDTLKDARKWATAQERAADLGGVVPGKMDGTLKPLIERYEREMWKARKWGPSKAQELKMLHQDLGNRLLSGLSSATVLTYAKGLGLSPGGVSSRLSYLREVLKTSKDLWGVRVPMDEIDSAIANAKRMKIAGKSGVRTRRPTQAELDAIISFAGEQTASQIDLATIVRVLSVLPLRIGELLGIGWDDLDEERRTALIRSRKHPDFRIKETNHQEVPLISFRGVDTYALIAGQPRYWASPFPYKAPSVSAAFHNAVLKEGIKDLHLHDLRAHALSRLLEASVPIPQVALISGHRNWKILARNYARLDAASVHDVIAQANEPAETQGTGEPTLP
jgi:integrase